MGFFFGLIMAYSTAERIIIKHIYTDGNLFEFHPTEVQLASGIALRVALEDATKRGVSLGSANLRCANLGGANLVGDRPIFIIGPIGSRCDYFTAYLTNKGIYLSAGCFFGSTADFTTNLANEHGESAHAKEYTAALLLIECHARLWTPANFETAPEAAEVK